MGAAAQTASRYEKVGFVLVLVGDDASAASGANVTTVGTGDGLRADVAAAVERAVDGRS